MTTEALDRLEAALREMAAGPYSCKPLFDDLALVRQEMAKDQEAHRMVMEQQQEIERLQEAQLTLAMAHSEEIERLREAERYRVVRKG